MLYLKGYKVDMQRMLNKFRTTDWMKSIHALSSVVPRGEYRYLSGTRCKQPLGDLEFVFVVEEGCDKEELERKPFGEPEGSYLREMANEILVPGVYASWGTFDFCLLLHMCNSDINSADSD
jgi:hypothetical protein